MQTMLGTQGVSLKYCPRHIPSLWECTWFHTIFSVFRCSGCWVRWMRRQVEPAGWQEPPTTQLWMTACLGLLGANVPVWGFSQLPVPSDLHTGPTSLCLKEPMQNSGWNYTTLLEEIKDNLNQWRGIPCSWIPMLKAVMMSIFPQVYLQIQSSPIKILDDFWGGDW